MGSMKVEPNSKKNSFYKQLQMEKAIITYQFYQMFHLQLSCHLSHFQLPKSGFLGQPKGTVMKQASALPWTLNPPFNVFSDWFK